MYLCLLADYNSSSWLYIYDWSYFYHKIEVNDTKMIKEEMIERETVDHLFKDLYSVPSINVESGFECPVSLTLEPFGTFYFSSKSIVSIWYWCKKETMAQARNIINVFGQDMLTSLWLICRTFIDCP